MNHDHGHHHHDDRNDERFDEQGNTRPTGGNFIAEHSEDGVDRRGFLRCMAWAGTATVWGLSGGIPKSFALGRLGSLSDAERKSIFFAQISDSHIGFAKEANKDVTATLEAAVARLNALPQRPGLVLHTGDITQLAKPGEFDTANEVLKGVKTDRVFYVPGEHDVATDNGVSYLQRYGKGTKGGGWYSFDHSGVHFVGLVNVLNLKAGGLGSLGAEQIMWLKRDVARLSSSTPIVLFAHVPLWTVYPEWGWGTDDSEQALALLKRFGSVTVLNGHIHQIMQKVEGHVSFHTAMSTAFPQPAPGTAPAPGPMKVEPERLKSVLGIANVSFVAGRGALAIVDTTLSGAPPAFAEISHEAMTRRSTTRPAVARGPNEIGIDNFAFAPASLTVKSGTKVVWINDDDVPHIVVNVEGRFKPSPLLDTNQRYSVTLTTPGIYKYFCSLHPQMQGKIVVE
ncbi:MAG TPA: plastocyanin/azurin family copper-binding protein [Gemmatimonadaceae bacterium]|nr:plastocyanin/azurin family copper-binding protein [Gemmatimonadaceae bacterium]